MKSYTITGDRSRSTDLAWGMTKGWIHANVHPCRAGIRETDGCISILYTPASEDTPDIRLFVPPDNTIRFKGEIVAMRDYAKLPATLRVTLETAFPNLIAQVAPPVDVADFEPEMEFEVVVDQPPTGLIPHEMDGITVYQRASDGYFNATAMCQAAGKRLNDYTRLAHTVEFLEVLSSATGNPVADLVISNMGGMPDVKGTWVHPDVAIHLAQWCSAKFAVQVSRWVREWFTTGLTPAVIDFSDTASLMVHLHNATGVAINERKLRLTATAEKNHALAVRDEAQNTARDMARQLSKEERAIPLTQWIHATTHIHGHGLIIGCKVMRALGLMHRENVKGCRNTKESVASADMIKSGILIMSSTDWEKKRKEREGENAVPVLGSDGQPIIGTSRVVLLDPDNGAEALTKWFLDRPECMLRRLLQQRPEDKVLKRLAGRYSFQAHNNDALEELSSKERDDCIIMVRNGEDAWFVSCNVRASARKGGKVYTALGSGLTLEDALYDLAEKYYDVPKHVTSPT